MDDETAQHQPAGDEESSGGRGGDPWTSPTATAAVEEGKEVPATTSEDGIMMVTHSEGETFTMPQSDTTNTRANEFLTSMSNLGSIISTKAREVDQQTGISTKVADVNEKYHVSEKWVNFTTVTKQKTLDINEKYHVADKWSNLTSTMAARVKQIKEDRRKRLEEATDAEGGSNNNNLARENVIKSLNGVTVWVSQRIQGIRAAGSVDENDGRGTELPESK